MFSQPPALPLLRPHLVIATECLPRVNISHHLMRCCPRYRSLTKQLQLQKPIIHRVYYRTLFTDSHTVQRSPGKKNIAQSSAPTTISTFSRLRKLSKGKGLIPKTTSQPSAEFLASSTAAIQHMSSPARLSLDDWDSDDEPTAHPENSPPRCHTTSPGTYSSDDCVVTFTRTSARTKHLAQTLPASPTADAIGDNVAPEQLEIEQQSVDSHLPTPIKPDKPTCNSTLKRACKPSQKAIEVAGVAVSKKTSASSTKSGSKKQAKRCLFEG